MSIEHLIGAYGLFWSREEVLWAPGKGPSAWQLLGKRNKNQGALRVCDFRQARGFYILFNDYGASYVGLARGQLGLGQRLKAHDRDANKEWSRFCWFSFDDTEESVYDGWSSVKVRENVSSASADTTVREFEALLIKVLGIKHQNQMNFVSGQKWDQVTLADCYPSESLRKVSQEAIRQPEFRKAILELS